MSYFSRITLDASDYHANRMMRTISENSYREHQALWKLFPNSPDANRDFIYRVEQRDLRRVYYMVSQREPAHEQSWMVESKPYKPSISKGQMLAFSLRINPVVTRKDESGRHQRHDVVMDAKQQSGYQKLPTDERPPMSKLIQEAGAKWLRDRCEKHGFTFSDDSITIESYDQHQSYKQGNRRPIRYSTMDMAGVLRVEDVECFYEVLKNGIGPAKAFGCGLMLVRRI